MIITMCYKGFSLVFQSFENASFKPHPPPLLILGEGGGIMRIFFISENEQNPPYNIFTYSRKFYMICYAGRIYEKSCIYIIGIEFFIVWFYQTEPIYSSYDSGYELNSQYWYVFL